MHISELLTLIFRLLTTHPKCKMQPETPKNE